MYFETNFTAVRKGDGSHRSLDEQVAVKIFQMASQFHRVQSVEVTQPHGKYIETITMYVTNMYQCPQPEECFSM